MAWSAAAAALVIAVASPLQAQLVRAGWPLHLFAAALAAGLVAGIALWRSPELRQSL
jgi:hypothetical protein